MGPKRSRKRTLEGAGGSVCRRVRALVCMLVCVGAGARAHVSTPPLWSSRLAPGQMLNIRLHRGGSGGSEGR